MPALEKCAISSISLERLLAMVVKLKHECNLENIAEDFRSIVKESCPRCNRMGEKCILEEVEALAFQTEDQLVQ